MVVIFGKLKCFYPSSKLPNLKMECFAPLFLTTKLNFLDVCSVVFVVEKIDWFLNWFSRPCMRKAREEISLSKISQL